MTYSDEEIGLIDGVIQSYFAPRSVSQHLREKYWNTHQHIAQSRIGRAVLVNIREALSFLLPAFDGDRQTQRDLVSALAKTKLLLKNAD